MASRPTKDPCDSDNPLRALLPSARGSSTLETRRKRTSNPVHRFLKVLGPGVITGASDDDPSGIGTYALAGAAFGYATLWTAPVTFPLMAAVQFMCAKVGLVSGRGLAGVLRRYYSRPLLYLAVGGLVFANTLNAGADIGAIAAGLNLLFPVPIAPLIVPVALVILALQVWGSYRLIAQTFQWLTLALVAYIGATFSARPDWGQVVRGTLLPTFRFESGFLATLVALLGTTISPYLFFWQAGQEVEEEKAQGRKRLWQRQGGSTVELRYAAWDVTLGMFFSNVVMYFIILATGATLHQAGRTDIRSAAEAAEALRPLAGDAAGLLLALGLVGTGFLAVPVLTTSAAYAVAEAFDWEYGLDERPEGAKEFYAVIAASTLVGLGVNFLGLNPVDALFWTAVVNGFLTPPLLVMILLIANNRAVMGDRVNGWGLNALGWAATAAMFAAAIGLVLTWGGS